MGHTIYYRLAIEEWEKAVEFIHRVGEGIGLEVKGGKTLLVVKPQNERIEPLTISRKINGFAKTYGLEPYTSLYLLILYSLSVFGSSEVWED